VSAGFRVDPKDAVPIWRQIELGMRRLVASGALAPGTAVPSMRDLAQELGVNPMTVAKAYQRLADAGIVESRKGEGTFVAERPALSGRTERARGLRQEADRFAGAAAMLGASEQEAVEETRRAFVRLRREGPGAGGVS
jgi:DNA-binding transcriptional regulator YhcF (GntR family)